MAFLSVFRDAYNFLFPKSVRSNEVISKPNLGEELRLMINGPEFGEQWRATCPFLVAALTGWPLYWIYRGCVWRKTKGIQPLALYINKTYYQAKILEAGILVVAVLAFLKSSAQQNTPQKPEVQEVSYKP